MKKNLTVVKSNRLIEASFRLSLNEQRLILHFISKLDSTERLNKQEDFKINVLEFAETFGISKKNAYTYIKDASDRLFERHVKIRRPRSVLKTRWISSIDYKDNEGDVTLSFAPKIIPYLSKLKDNFTQYKIEHISKMTSVYSVRMYELLIQWGSVGQRKVSLEDLRLYFGLHANEYGRMDIFKQKVLDFAIDQINEHSNLKVSYRQIKKGRKISHFDFNFDFKKHLNRKISSQKQTKKIKQMELEIDNPMPNYQFSQNKINSVKDFHFSVN